MNPDLAKFYLAAQAIIYNKVTYPKLKKMMVTRPGAIMAVQTVLQAINAKKPVPAEMATQLSVLIYLVLCATIAKDIGKQPDPQVVQGVVQQLAQGAAQQQAAPAQPQQPQQQPQPQGLVGSAMAGA